MSKLMFFINTYMLFGKCFCQKHDSFCKYSVEKMVKNVSKMSKMSLFAILAIFGPWVLECVH